MKMAGRPTKLTPELQKKIIDAIRAGNYMETAAAYAGISKDTFFRWLRKGARAKSGIYKEFHDAVEKALAEAEVRDVMIIANAATSDWKAAAWRLERKFPDRWGRKESVNDERRLKLEQMKFGIEKIKKETEFIEERTKQIKGAAKDTSLLNALIDVLKGDNS